jgi:hypothetical protein
VAAVIGRRKRGGAEAEVPFLATRRVGAISPVCSPFFFFFFFVFFFFFPTSSSSSLLAAAAAAAAAACSHAPRTEIILVEAILFFFCPFPSSFCPFVCATAAAAASPDTHTPLLLLLLRRLFPALLLIQRHRRTLARRPLVEPKPGRSRVVPPGCSSSGRLRLPESQILGLKLGEVV